MSNSVKLKGDNYLDSSSIVHNKIKLNEILAEDEWIQLNSNYNTFYRKIRKTVELNFNIYSKTGIVIGANETKTIGNLVMKCRPAKEIGVPVFAKEIGDSSNYRLRILIRTNGNIDLHNWGPSIILESVQTYVNFLV